MTRTATPANEATLLNVAKHGTAQHVEKLVRQHRRVQRLNNKTGSRAGDSRHEARSLSWYYDEDGMLVLRGRFAPEEGAVVVKALEAAMDAIERSRLKSRGRPRGRKRLPALLQKRPNQRNPQKRFCRTVKRNRSQRHRVGQPRRFQQKLCKRINPKPRFQWDGLLPTHDSASMCQTGSS